MRSAARDALRSSFFLFIRDREGCFGSGPHDLRSAGGGSGESMISRHCVHAWLIGGELEHTRWRLAAATSSGHTNVFSGRGGYRGNGSVEAEKEAAKGAAALHTCFFYAEGGPVYLTYNENGRI